MGQTCFSCSVNEEWSSPISHCQLKYCTERHTRMHGRYGSTASGTTQITGRLGKEAERVRETDQLGTLIKCEYLLSLSIIGSVNEYMLDIQNTLSSPSHSPFITSSLCCTILFFCYRVSSGGRIYSIPALGVLSQFVALNFWRSSSSHNFLFLSFPDPCIQF